MRKFDSDVKTMTSSQLRQEVMRLRRGIKRWAKTYQKNGNERCHEVDEGLVRLVGVSLYPNRKVMLMTATRFRGCCDHYISRECRAGRLIDDRT